MRLALAVLAIIALIIVGAWAYTRPPAPTAVPSPSPTATAPATGAASSPAPTTSATGATSPTPSPSGTPTAFGPPLVAGGVTVRASAATPSADFRYLTTRESTGQTHWVVLLDLAGRRANYVAEIAIEVPAGSQSVPRVRVSPSRDGRLVLITATEAGNPTHLFLLDVTAGRTRALLRRDTFISAVLAPDGSRFAFHERSGDAAREGLWIGTVANGSTRRLIADDPQDAAGVQGVASFSLDGRLVAARTAESLGDTQLAAVDVDGPELRTEGDIVPGATMLAGVHSVDWRGAPRDVWGWSVGRVPGGSTGLFSFDLEAQMRPPAPPGYAARMTIYEDHDTPPDHFVLQSVDRHPDLQRFVTWESSGFGGPGVIHVRTRDGGATKVADTDEAGPHSPWWSPDGSRLYALVSGDDSVGSVVDVLTGEAILTYCIRNAGPGCV